MKINENIALAKSVLKKQGVSETDEDYLKIRELVGKSFNYVGILTRLRYVDNVTDFDELSSIFDILKNSKLDIGKLNRLTYDEILSTFYDEMNATSNKNKEDYELIFKDKTYSYFRVHTYKGILEIGSPAWCLKTKSNWDAYQAKYPEQWVIIDNRYVRSAITPNNNYLGGQYVNNGKTWIRFGVSICHSDDGMVNWVGHDDNDGRCEMMPNNSTFFGVFNTVLNLSNGKNKSFYESFCNTKHIVGGISKITNKNSVAWERLGISPERLKYICDDDDEAYICLSKTYTSVPLLVVLKKDSVPYVMIFTKRKEIIEPIEMDPVNLEPKDSMAQAILDYVNQPRSAQYIGIRIKLGFITLEQAMSNDNFVCKSNNWLVYSWNENYYIAVDTEPTRYIFPSADTSLNMYHKSIKFNNQPIVYLIDKKTLKGELDFPDVTQSIKDAKGIKNPITNFTTKTGKTVSKFWDFIKKQPLL